MKTSKFSLSELSVKSFVLNDQTKVSALRGGENDPGYTLVDRQSCVGCTQIIDLN